jgi:predicted MFS family arabinose efflux permease
VTLNAIAFNIARALGPAIGGIVVAAAGAAAACGRGEAPHALIPTSIPAPVSRSGTKRLAA